MDLRELTRNLNNQRGFAGQLFRVSFWIYNNFRPPSLLARSNQQYVMFDRYLKNSGVVLLIGSNLPSDKLHYGDNKVVQIDVKSHLEYIDLAIDAEVMSGELSDFDYVVSSSMLEHTPRPWKVISEVHKVLKPGGVFYLSVPWMYPLHDEPYDYWRFSLPCLQQLLADYNFEELEAGSERSGHASLSEFLRCYIPEAFSFDNQVAYHVIRYVLVWITFPLELIERFFRLRNGRQHYYTDSILYIVGRKPL